MTEAREAVYDGDGSWTFANCYACGSRLAEASNRDIPGRDPNPRWYVALSSRLVARGTIHAATGLPQYGPPKRPGRTDPIRHNLSVEVGGSIVRGSAGGLKTRTDFYVHCPEPICDRGQAVHVSKMRRPWT